MMRLKLAGSLLGILVLSAAVLAENPQAASLRQQIDSLKAQKKATDKTLHAWYEGFIKRDKLSEEILIAERKALGAQEQELLGLATNDADREAVHLHFDGLRAYLKAGARLDAAVIRELRHLEKAHVNHVDTVYKAKIAELEAAHKLATKPGPTKPKK